MRRLCRFLRLPAAERQLLISAVLLLWAVKLGLMLLPFHTLRQLLSKLARVTPGLSPSRRSSVKKVVWAVEAAGRLVPWASTCLTQALTAQVLLLRRGYPALVHIGAVKGEGGGLQAHAWVENEGDVVIGGHELEQYTPLVVFDGGRR
jgi:hypothetical protein